MAGSVAYDLHNRHEKQAFFATWELELVKKEIRDILTDRTLSPIHQLVKIREVIG